MSGAQVFLSHDSRDKAEVERLAHRLADEGIHPWLDKWELQLGRPWLPAIERALQEIPAIAVCIGKHGMGRVQEPEVQVALDEAFRKPERLVIPILLPGAPRDVELSPFLRRHTWVDLRTDDGSAVALLVRTLQGQAPAPVRKSSGRCPYRGLAAFEEEHARSYFGRQPDVLRLLQVLQRGERLLAVLGPSGSGKSSLLRAGLVPSVKSGQLDGSYHWQVVVMRPGPRPCHELAVRLAQLLEEDLVRAARLAGQLESSLRANTSALSDTLDVALAGKPGSPRVLLVVDQFEEVFTQAAEPQEGEALIHNLLHAGTVRGGRVHVVLGLRADYLGRCLQHAALAEYLSEHRGEYVRPMSEQALREAIERPAYQEGIRFEKGLVDVLVAGVRGQPGDLPLLQFVLDALWREREGETLTWEAYRRLGGLEGAITRRADGLLEQMSEQERAQVRRLFGRLILLGEEKEDTRRLASREELVDGDEEGAGRTLDRLVEAKLLTAREGVVEVAHEALIRKWERLRTWVAEDREALQLRQELGRVASLWNRAGRPADDLLRGGRLQRALELRSSGRIPFSPLEAALLEESEKAERAVQQRELEAAQQLAAERGLAARRLWVGLGGMGLLFVLLMIQSQLAQREYEEKQQRVRDATQMAEQIVFVIDRELEPMAGIAPVRRKLLDQSAHLLDRLLEATRDNLEARYARMVLHYQRGDVAFSHEDLTSARREYEAAVVLARQLVESQPHVKRDLAIGYQKLGMVAGNVAETRGYYEKSLRLFEEQLEADPQNVQWRRDLARSYESFGGLENQAGNQAGARLYHEKALTLFEALAKADPGNAELKRSLAGIYSSMGGEELAAGNVAGARSYYEKSLVLGEELVKEDPRNVWPKRQLASTHAGLGALEQTADNLTGARSQYGKYLALSEELAKADPQNAPLKWNVALGYRLLGDVEQSMGNPAGAREQYEKYLALSEELAKADPGDAKLKKECAIGHQGLGGVAGNVSMARGHYGKSLELLEALAKADPQDAWLMQNLMTSYTQLGGVEASSGNLAAARVHYEKAFALAERSAKSNPRTAWLKHYLLAGHSQMGSVEASSGNLAAARAHYEKASSLAEELAKADPLNSWLKQQVAMGYLLLGWSEEAVGKLEAARGYYDDSLALSEALAKAGPQNAQLKQNLVDCHNHLGSMELAVGNGAAARAHFEKAFALSEELTKVDPRNAGPKRNVANGYMLLGGVAEEAGRLADARSHYEKSIALAEALSEADPQNAYLKRDVAIGYQRLGWVEALLNVGGAARKHQEAGLALLEKLSEADPRNAYLKRDLSVSHHELGAVEEKAGNLARAQEHAEKSLALSQELSAMDPRNMAWRLDGVGANLHLAQLLQKRGQPEAHVHRRTAEQHLEHLTREGLATRLVRFKKLLAWSR